MHLLRFFILSLILLPTSFLLASNVIVEHKINWSTPIDFTNEQGVTKQLAVFNHINYNEDEDFLPYYSNKVKTNQEIISAINILDVEFMAISESEAQKLFGFNQFKNSVDLSFFNGIDKKINYAYYSFSPIIYDKKNGSYKKVVSYKFEVITQKPASYLPKRKSFTANSVLETGEWYKIAVVNDGVFKITHDFLKDLGMDVNNINPLSIKIYGNSGKMLPRLNSDYRPDDLQQNAIYVEGEADGIFNKNDFILFYGQSPHSWELNSSTNRFTHKINEYSDTSYYFITASNTGQGSKRITTQPSLPNPNINVAAFSDYDFHEKDIVNLIKSGSDWYGETFDVITNYNFRFSFPNIVMSSPVFVEVLAAARSNTSTIFTISTGVNSFTIPISGTDINNHNASFAIKNSNSISFNPTNNIIDINVNFNKPNSLSTGWLNKIELNARRNLIMNGNQLFFRDLNSVGVGNVAQFSIGNATFVKKIWDITDPFDVKEQNYTFSNGTISFSAATDSLKQFVALTDNFEAPIPKGSVENQNLHGITQADLIIVSHPMFLNHADQLSSFHADEGLNVIIVTPQQIYNEFSSGSTDIVAIRDFIRMLYERASNPTELPRYLLLLGDGSYDNKSRTQNNTNFIPTFQSLESLNPLGTQSYVSDDYYGLLDPSEGVWTNPDVIDICIGRIPVKSSSEANNVVNKILNYNTSYSMQDWRNQITFVGDDEDSNTHMLQANEIADTVINRNREFNVDKLLIDAFKQVATPGGNRYPEVNEKLDKAVNDGTLIINYTGHGGEVGWATERILSVPMINSWENTKGFPLFVTATCEFSRFDDPARTSAGELVLLNKHGGIALFTTVRTVFSSPNFALNKVLYDTIFEQFNSDDPTLGEVFRNVKNSPFNLQSSNNRNNRNFTLLGDPALKLAIPKQDVVTTKLNGNSISSTDTIKALSKVNIEGIVTDRNGVKLTNFNGIISPTVYDKAKQITTLQNDGGAAMQFNLQTSKLFKGKVSVINGDFSFSFVVPKDISFSYGKGKLSYYAENQSEDANGFFDDFYIGGMADSVPSDKEGPKIELYMNDDSFISGGMTDDKPILLAYVEDEFGINMVGNGIGHDIVAVLDDKTSESFILNDFYEANLNSYQKGSIRFPFKDLTEGRHKLNLKVWDVYNNSSEATIDFVVVKSNDLVLDKVYNYPNPFTTYTEFWFEHNQPGKQLFAQVQIFTITGKLVQTLEQHIFNEGFRSSSITWNGLDKYGDQIGRGVYIYKLRVRAENLSVAEKIQKLVILR